MKAIKTVILLVIMSLMLGACATSKPGPTVSPVTPSNGPAEEFKLPEFKEPAAKSPSTKKPEAIILDRGKDDDQYILLNFDNADINTIVATFGELLEMNYILGPGVTGSVTIQSYKKFPSKDLFQVFLSILEINGLTAVRDGNFYRIIPIEQAKQTGSDIEKGKDVAFRLDASFVTQIMPLENVKAADIAEILRGFMPRGTDIVVYEPTNLLIITALPNTLSKFMKIIDALDITDAESESIKTFVYNVENGEAKKLEGVLKSIYSMEQELTAKTPAVPQGQQQRAAVPPTPVPQRQQQQQRIAVNEGVTTTVGGAISGDLGDISIIAYEDINALIIKSTPRTYLTLLEILKKIDLPPKQVLIEVMIAEISLKNSFEYGLEWMIKNPKGDLYGLDLDRANITIPPVETTHPGAFAAVISGTWGKDLFNSVLKTIASNTDLNILASPIILALDNKEAEIKIGNEVPTATSTTQSSEGATTSSQIQYKTVGTLLTVTPHITDKGNVSMKIVVESSDVGSDTVIGTGKYPSFITRKATTSAVVTTGHTLFLGGLISDKITKSEAGIPFIRKIPIIGYLFESMDRKKDKTELLVMVTPHVIANQEDADVISGSFQNRVRTIRDNLKATKLEIPDRDDDMPASTSESSSEDKAQEPQQQGERKLIEGVKK